MVQYGFVIIWKKNTAAVMPGHLPLLDRANKIRKDSCMKNFHSRLTAAILSAALLVTVLPAGVLAEEPEQLPAANAAPDCTCTISCTEEAKNEECAVCGADGAALEACAANAADMQTEEDALAHEDEIALLDVQDGVAYVDETGADQTHDGVTAVTAEDSAWESGWYIAQGEITIDNRVAVNGTVVLILEDDCDLTVNGGIDVSAGNSFTVYGQEGGSGSLTAAGSTYNSNSGAAGIGGNTDAVDFGDITLAATGTIEATGGYRAAGIGGGKVNNQVLTTGNITICSGVVKANGGAFAAGIGNGADGIRNSGTIRISGGTVTADGSAAIGAGYNGYAGDIEISGGTIFANGNGVIGADAQWRGGMDGRFTTGENGHAVIFADSIQDQDQKADWSGVIFQGKAGQVYGTSVAPAEDFTIGSGYTLTIPWDATLHIQDSITATNNGTIENCGTISGTVAGNAANTRLALEILDENGMNLEGKISFGQTLTLRAFGPNLPEDAVSVNFICNGRSLGDAEVRNGVAVLEISILEAAGGDWLAGGYTFQAEAEGIIGQQTAALRYLLSSPEPRAEAVTQTAITLQEISYPELSPAPTVQYGYVRAGETAKSISWKSDPQFTGLDAGTDYLVFVRIKGDANYHEVCSEGVRISTEPGLSAFPAGGLDLANGSVEIKSGVRANLIVTQGTDLYDVDEDTIIPVTGDGTANHAQIVLQNDSTAHVLLSNAHMKSADYYAPIQVKTNSALSLTLDGENSLLFSDSYTEAGIQIMWESSLEIDGDGALTIGTPDMAPRVGIGTEMEGFDQITLLGGKVTVYGRYVGVGVGDAWYGGEEKSAVIISGGSLYAEIAEDDPRGAAIGGRPMNEWMEAVCGVQITGGTVVAGNGGICGDVTVTGGSVAGVIESLTNARVPARITAPIGAAVEALTLRNASGAAAAYGCPAVVPDSGELTLYLPSGTYSGAMLVDGQLKTFTGLTASGDIQSAVSLTDTGVRVDLPDGTQVPLETDGADMVLPDDSAIQTGSGPVITIDEDAAVSPEGEITLPGGGSATVNDGTGNGITVTAPPAGGTIVPGADGSVMLPGGSTVQTGDQTVTIPDGGGLLQPDGELRYTVTVTFDSRGGSAVSTQEITAGSLLTQPEQPVRSGYRFTGWYQDAACTVAWDFDAMPVTEDLTLYAGWKKTSSGGSSGGSGSSAGNSGSEKEPSGGQAAQDHPFEDVAEGTYYHDAVLWAVENGITAGVTETLFAPGQACTRAQMVTFLWRAAGSPAPTATENPFADVAESAYYHDAVLWAAENGITGGTSAGTFSPNATVTRAQTVTFLYRAAGAPAVSGGSFADVEADAYYADAVVWAAEQGITSGTTAETFSPAQACTRAQIVTFLYRDRA